VPWNRSPSKHRFKIEIFIKTFGYSVKFDVRKKEKKKIMAFTEMLFFCRGWTEKKFSNTAMADSAID